MAGREDWGYISQFELVAFGFSVPFGPIFTSFTLKQLSAYGYRAFMGGGMAGLVCWGWWWGGQGGVGGVGGELGKQAKANYVHDDAADDAD